MPLVHNRVILSGVIGSSEVFSTSCAMMGMSVTPTSVVETQTELNDWASDIATELLGASIDNIKGYMSTVTTITAVTCQFKAGPNLVLQSVPAVLDLDGTGTNYKPYQSAIVASLRTGVPGGSHRGRMYWPGTAAVVGSNGLMSGATSYAADVHEVLTLFQNTSMAYNEVRPAIYSSTQDSLTAVSSIRVGDVVDTQRRRRDNLPETYATVAYP